MYTSGRRRTILILLVTSLLLVTIDMRGNTMVDKARTAMSYVLSPFETAGNVIAGPIDRFWAGVVEVDDLRAENQRLRDELDQVAGEQITSQNALATMGELQNLNNIDRLADIPRVTGTILGASPSNFDHRIEINVGSVDGVDVGMPVANAAGVVGRITEVYPETSEVMLITDPQYFVAVKVVAGSPANSIGDVTPSGIPVDELEEEAERLARQATTAPPTTVPPTSVGDETPDTTEAPADPDAIGQESPPTDTTQPANPGSSVPVGSTPTGSTPEGSTPGGSTPELSVPPESTTTTTTTTTIPPVRETGTLNGKGRERLPRIEFIADAPQFGELKPGDVVLTTGGRESNAPRDLPIGWVRRIWSTGGVEGLQIEVELAADLKQLNYLTVFLYKSPTEVSEN